MIKRVGNKFRVVSEHGDKNLGESTSKEGAVKRLRQVEWFKHHAKAIVDPELVKDRQYLPVVFQNKDHAVKKEKDFPSTSRTYDLKDVKQPDFPTTPYSGEAYAESFDNQTADDGENPDPQRKGSDFASPMHLGIQEKNSAGRGGSADPLATNQQIFQPPQKAEGGHALPVRESVIRNSRKKNEKPKSIRQIAVTNTNAGGQVSDFSRGVFIDLKKGKVRMYTQNQPLDPSLKPVAEVTDDALTEIPKEKPSGSLKITTFTGKHVGKSYAGPFKRQSLSKEAIEQRKKQAKEDIDFSTKQQMTKWRDPKYNTEKSKTPYEAGRKKMKYIGSRLELGEKEGDYGKYFGHGETQANRRLAQHSEAMANKFGREKAAQGVREAAGDVAVELKKKEMKERYGKSEMPETALPPPKEKTNSPAGTVVQRIKQKMAERDKLENEEKGHRPNEIKGGVGDDLQPKDVDQNELASGVDVEMEHVGKNPEWDEEKKEKVSQDIALDHLAEDPKYYTKLAEMEGRKKQEAKDETKKRKLLKLSRFNEMIKSVLRQKKLEGVVSNAEKMARIRQETGASPNEMRMTLGQLRAYNNKLKAERRKNEAIRASEDPKEIK